MFFRNCTIRSFLIAWGKAYHFSVVSTMPCIAASGYKPSSDWISGYILNQSLFLPPAPYTRYEPRVAICSSTAWISVRSGFQGSAHINKPLKHGFSNLWYLCFSAATFCMLALFPSILCAQCSLFDGFHGTLDHHPGFRFLRILKCN